MKQEKMKLISMTDFVLEQESKLVYPNQNAWEYIIREKYLSILNYANFLKQPLKLGMFIPCNELDEPYPSSADEYWKDKEGKLSEQYQQAKERVLFEGFKQYAWNHSKDVPFMVGLEKTYGCVYWFRDGVWELSNGLKTVEDLVLFQPTLTQSAIKIIGI